MNKKRRLAICIFVCAILLAAGLTACKKGPQSGVNFDRAEYIVARGEDITLTPVVENGDGALVWSSSDESVATADQNGVVIGLKIGQAEITAKSGKAKGSCIVIVTENPAAPSFHVNEESISLGCGDHYDIAVSAFYAGDPIDAAIHISSGNTAVATVSDTGRITAQGVGDAVITVLPEWRGYRREFTINVSVIPELFIELSGRDAALFLAGTSEQTQKQITVLGVWDNETVIVPPAVGWRSSDTSVATVSNGLITAAGLGKAVITAVYQDGSKRVEGYVNITVSRLPVTLTETAAADLTWDYGAAEVSETMPYALAEGSVIDAGDITGVFCGGKRVGDKDGLIKAAFTTGVYTVAIQTNTTEFSLHLAVSASYVLTQKSTAIMTAVGTITRAYVGSFEGREDVYSFTGKGGSTWKNWAEITTEFPDRSLHAYVLFDVYAINCEFWFWYFYGNGTNAYSGDEILHKANGERGIAGGEWMTAVLPLAQFDTIAMGVDWGTDTFYVTNIRYVSQTMLNDIFN